MDFRQICTLLDSLQKSGYEILSISGGEPLVYSHIDEIIDYAHSIGLRVNLITNGMIIDRLIEVAPKINIFAISIDGTEAKHDLLRNQKGAYSTLINNFRILNEHAIPFGLAFCATKENLANLTDVYDLALEHHAVLLQIHPLVKIGRGEKIDEICLSDQEIDKLFLTAKLLEEASKGTGLAIQLDVLPKNALESAQSCLFSATNEESISDFINPLVITEKGEILPYAYGIDNTYSLGTIDESWDKIVQKYKQEDFYKIKHLVINSFNEFQNSDKKIIDWYYSIVHLSRSQEVAFP